MLRLFSDPAKEAAFKKWQNLESGIDRIHHEDKRRMLGFEPDDLFGFFDLQWRYFYWRTKEFPKTPEHQKPKELLAMVWATEGLLLHAMVHANKNPRLDETAFREQSQTLWDEFLKKNNETIAMQYDDACEVFFSQVSDLPSREIIVDPFNFAPIRFTLELTYLFHTNRERCSSSLERARQFDGAYLILFKHRNGPELSFADHPYSPVLEGTLDAPLPLPGVEIPLAEPLRAEAPQEEQAEILAPFIPNAKKYFIHDSKSSMTKEEAYRCFGYEPNQDFTIEDITARLAQWRNDKTREQNEEHYQLMTQAFYLLSSEKIISAWDNVSSSSMTLKEALKVFGKEPHEKPPGRMYLNYEFGQFSRWSITTVEEAEKLDAAYRVLFEHAEVLDNHKEIKLEPPFAPTLKVIIGREKAAGWESPKQWQGEISNKKAHAVFGIEDVGKMLPYEVTEKFEELQGDCTTVEEAEKLDLAYRWLFSVCCKYEKDFTEPIASPYAPILAQKLVIATAPPVLEETPAQEEVIEAPARSEEMTVEHAREVFDYAKDEIPTRVDLRERYQNFLKRNLDEVIQEEIDEAYAVLLKIAV